MSIFKKSVLVMLAFFGFASQANAALITETFDFTVPNIVGVNAGPIFTPPPTNPVIGSLTLSRNTALLSSTGSVTVNNLNTPLDYPLGYSYGTFTPGSGLGTNQLYIGDSINGSLYGAGFPSGKNTFSLTLLNIATSNLSIEALAYARSSISDTLFIPSGGGGTITERISGVSAVPLPASLPMFGAAIVGLGILGYRRKKLSATA